MLLKSFRLFVSSTFKDFAQERELLQSTVFPALDAYCAARGYQFHAVDLRWGVNEEAQLDQRTAEICLGEVSAAKGYPAPNFLIMVGDRYGWVPLPFAIAQDEFEAALTWLDSRGEHDALHDLRHVYKLDENYVIPCGLLAGPGARPTTDTSAYTLRSRQDEIAELKDAATWEKLEARLRAGLQAASNRLFELGRIDAAGHQKYVLSLTEQEIIRGLPGYGRGGATDAAAAPKQADAAGPQAIAWIRERTAPRRTGLLRRWLAPSPAEPEPDPKVAALSSAIRQALPENSVVTATASTDAAGKFDQAYLDTFVSTIQRKLEAAIDARIAAVEKQQTGPDGELLIERAEHRAFAEKRCKVFFGRDSNRAAIAGYIAGGSTHPLVLYGPSGSGKSTLMARAVADAEAAGGAPVIYRFIGASAVSSDQRAMLTSLVDDLAANGIAEKPVQWEDDANKFVAQVRELLSAIDKPVVIFLDALDQLRKPYRPAWLPDRLPSVVKIIVSVLDDALFPVDSGVYKSLRQRLPADAVLEIEPLEANHGHDILAGLEQAARRRHQPGQRDYIVGQFIKAGASPLYLRVAFEIARGWRSTDMVGVGRRELAEDTTALIAQFIDELSTLHHHEPVLVSRTLGYIAAAKDGLSSSELIAVLSRDADIMLAISSEQHGAQTSRLPVSVWVRLHRHLEALLVEKRIDEQPLLQFFHRQLAEVTRERFYAGSKSVLHGALSAQFDAPVDPTPSEIATYKGNGPIYSRRSLSELPYQLFHAERRSRLDEFLLAPDWMQQKLNAFGPQTLVADYEEFGRTPMQSLVGRTLRLTTGILARDPRQLLPQLNGRLMACAEVVAQRILADVRRHVPRPSIITQHPSLMPPGAETVRLEGHTDRVTALTVLTDDRLASGSADTTIRLWNPKTGIETVRLDGHSSYVTAIAVLPDGRLASGSADRTIRLWDLTTCSETARLEGGTTPIYALTVITGGRLASGSGDGTIRIWDPNTRTETARLKGHMNAVRALTVLQDGRLVSASDDTTVRLWDVAIGAETVQLNGHCGSVQSLVVLPDGRLASGSSDNTIRLWDANTGNEIAQFESDTNRATALAVMTDGRLAWGSSDNSIEIWDADKAAEPARLEGHSGWIDALTVLADGRLGSGSWDGTIRLWDPKLGAEPAERERHWGSVGVSALAVLSDGRLASGSDDKTIRVWDTACTKPVRLRGHGDWVVALAALPNGTLASGSDDGTVRLWDTKTGTQTAARERHFGPVKALTVLPDGRLASGSTDKTIRLWEVETLTETTLLEGHAHRVNTLTVLRDGRLASGSGDGTIRLWDLTTGAETTRLQAGTGMVMALTELCDGTLASGSNDKTVRLWDVATGVEASRIEGHLGTVHALAVLPDGRLVSGSYDKTVRLWQPKSGTEITRLEFDAPVLSLCCLSARDEKPCRLVAGDLLGRLHWLELIE